MSERNKAVVRQYAEAFSRGDFEAIRTLCTPDFVVSGVMGKGDFEMALKIWNALHHAFGLQLEIEDLIAEGDRVAARFLESGTFRQPFFEKQPTGKSYRVTAMEWFAFRDGKIAERWGARDSASIFKQLGAE